MENELSREQIEEIMADRSVNEVCSADKFARLCRMALAYLDAKADAQRWRDEWEHSCDAVCGTVSLWIHRCPHCGRPAPAPDIDQARGAGNE